MSLFFYLSSLIYFVLRILAIFNETYGNGYLKLQWVGLIDEFYGYTIGTASLVNIFSVSTVLKDSPPPKKKSIAIFPTHNPYIENGIELFFYIHIAYP